MSNWDDKTILNKHANKQEIVNSTTKGVWTLDLKGTKRHISVEDFYSSGVSKNINSFITLKDGVDFWIYVICFTLEKGS